MAGERPGQQPGHRLLAARRALGYPSERSAGGGLRPV